MQIVFTAKEVSKHDALHQVWFSDYGLGEIRAECSCGWTMLGPRRNVYDAAAIHDLPSMEEDQCPTST
jgi:hypothetical protein